ncbi:MAG: nucleotidyltransferase family protein [Pseudomonadota bacterium]
MNAVDTAMILAAGFGTRMGALTNDRPKPLLKAGGRTLIDRVLDHVASAGLTKAVVNLHYKGDQIRHELSERAAPEIVFSEEHPDILDTGGGVVHALPKLGRNPFVTINSDAVFIGPNPLQALLSAWNPANHDALLLMTHVSNAMAYTRCGDFFLSADGDRPRRRGAAEIAPFVYSGAQIIAPGVFSNAPAGPFSTNIIWDRLLSEGRLAAVEYTGQWIDVGTPDGLEIADKALT